MQLYNEYSVMLLLCSRCGKVVILNVFTTGTNVVIFACFLSCVLGVFNRSVATPGSSGLAHVFDYTLYRRMRACFVYLCHHPLSHFTNLLTRPLSLDLITVLIFSFHVWPFAFMLQVT